MSLYKDVKELFNPIDLTLDMMKKFIQPTIYSGLKSNIEAVYFKTKQQEKKNKLLELYQYLWKKPIIEQEYSLEQIQKMIDKIEEELK